MRIFYILPKDETVKDIHAGEIIHTENGIGAHYTWLYTWSKKKCVVVADTSGNNTN